MSELAIRVENLSKQYRIGEAQPQYKTLRDSLVSSAKRLIPSNRNGSSQTAETTIWALNDVSFEIQQGEVVGIIGRNGAGKSTLLKVLAHITSPTKGRVEIHGRVGSLLEVGTGFHDELTGRENIYLNGAILGMKRLEIDRKFDEIVDFAEIEKFLDTPVKHYSSGMYMRLAFAVAAHLEPEILLVDEVLAVGDAQFQKKCLGKMGDVASEGRTVLFVSHNMAAVSMLCDHCILLNKGEVNCIGSTNRVIDEYVNNVNRTLNSPSPGIFPLTERVNSYMADRIIISKVRLLDSNKTPQETFQMGKSMTITIEIDGMHDYKDAWIGIIFKSRDDQMLTGINTGMVNPQVNLPRCKNEEAILHIPHLPFTPGIYWLAISVTRGGVGRIDYVDHAARFYIVEADVYGTGYMVSPNYGVFYLDATWEISPKIQTDENKIHYFK